MNIHTFSLSEVKVEFGRVFMWKMYKVLTVRKNLADTRHYLYSFLDYVLFCKKFICIYGFDLKIVYQSRALSMVSAQGHCKLIDRQ